MQSKWLFLSIPENVVCTHANIRSRYMDKNLLKSIFVFLYKVLFSSLAFVIGMILGGPMTTLLGLPAPILPPEIEAGNAAVTMFATSPLLILALYLVNRHLAGSWVMRGAILFLLTWIAYSVNNVIEATIFTSYGIDPWFTIVSFLPAVLLSALVTAWLFPTRYGDQSLGQVWRVHFQQRTPGDCAWRLLLAAVIFMPIYYLFGLLVVPFVGDYYQQGAFGLAQPALDTLLLVLLVRSLLFLAAALPVVVAWQETRRSLILSLGTALFIMVGLLYMLSSNWIAPHVRVIHSLEILADSLGYAGALAWLLFGVPTKRQSSSETVKSFTTLSQYR